MPIRLCVSEINLRDLWGDGDVGEKLTYRGTELGSGRYKPKPSSDHDIRLI